MKIRKSGIGIVLVFVMIIALVGCNNVSDDAYRDETPVIGTTTTTVTEKAEENDKTMDDEEGKDFDPLEKFSIGEAVGKYGVKFGAAIEPHLLDEEEYAEALIKDFTVLTPENYMKWKQVHPSRDTFDFTGGDKIVNFAKENNMAVRGHALLWHFDNPEWLEAGDFSGEELEALLKEHIETVVGHYKGDVYAWDVVNEPLERSKMRESFWYNKMGEDYIEKAFRFAHEADPDAKLFINDYTLAMPGEKADAMYKLVVDLLDKGVPIDGVGFQFHMDMNEPFDSASIYKNLNRFADLGLIIDITELDIRIHGEPTEELLDRQARYYGEFMQIALAIDAVDSYTMWGFTDKYSWIPSFFEDQGAGLILDENYNRKPAYDQLVLVAFQGPVELAFTKAVDVTNRQLTEPLLAANGTTSPVVDGKDDDSVWEEAHEYSFGYNQLNIADQTLPDKENDIRGSFKVLYKDNVLYGLVHRQDNVTVNTIDDGTYKNDNVEVFIEYGTYFEQMRSIVGNDFEDNSSKVVKKSVWNEDGTVMEFMVELPEEDMTGLTVGFNIALADNDAGDMRKYQLYPFAGENKSYLGKELGLLLCQGDTPRAANFDKVLPTLKAVDALVEPTIDGVVDPFEWSEGTVHGMGYDLTGEKDHKLPAKDDATVRWKINYSENKIYGYTEVIDDQIEDLDQVEIRLFNDNEIVIKTSPNGESDISGEYKAFNIKWNSNMNAMEFILEMEEAIEVRTIAPFNIVYYDYDHQELKHLLSPFSGEVSDAYYYKGELQFVN